MKIFCISAIVQICKAIISKKVFFVFLPAGGGRRTLSFHRQWSRPHPRQLRAENSNSEESSIYIIIYKIYSFLCIATVFLHKSSILLHQVPTWMCGGVFLIFLSFIVFDCLCFILCFNCVEVCVWCPNFSLFVFLAGRCRPPAGSTLGQQSGQNSRMAVNSRIVGNV